MERTIFYSWQSDLPNSSNLGFIEDCLRLATKRLRGRKPISIELTIDKATRETAGAPDITESIFSKINKSSAFIADISIINSSSNDARKTPNPNVLIELGYAARTLGWEKIICIYNTDYGGLERLPFDLRNRRAMPYSLREGNKPDMKTSVTRQIEKAILEMHEKGILTDKVFGFLKKEIDQEILALLSHFVRILNPTGAEADLFGSIDQFLNYTDADTARLLGNKKVLGFYILKSFHEYENKIHDFVNQAITCQYYNREILNSLIDIYEWFAAYNSTKTRHFSKLLTKLDEKEDVLFVINSSETAHGSKYPDRCLLMKRINKNQGQVCNFGDFYPGIVPNLTSYYKLNKEYVGKYVEVIQLLIQCINKWIELTNKEVIIDFVKHFRIKKVDGDWL